MEKITLYLPAELLASYATLSRQQQRGEADIMLEALRVYIERQERAVPDWVGMIDTEGEFDSTNVKDWLRETNRRLTK